MVSSCDRFANTYVRTLTGMCTRENTHHLTLVFPSAFHSRNDNHNRNTAVVSPPEKMIGLILFLRYLISKIRKDFLIKHLTPVPEIILFSGQGNRGNGREGRQ